MNFKLTQSFKIQHFFLLFALLWGSLQALLMPPLQVPDETAHFIRSWGVASGQFRCYDTRVLVPENLTKFAEAFTLPRVKNGSCNLAQVLGFASEKMNSPLKAVFCHFSAYNPLGYLPQAVGLDLARGLNLSILHATFLGRFFNLLASVLLIFLAIKFAPFGKEIFLCTALLPMSLNQLASFSNDALVLAGLMFFTSQILYFTQKDRLQNRELAYLALISLIFVQIKPGYIPVLLLLLLLSPRQFAGRGRYASFLVTVAVLSLAETFLLGQLVDFQQYIVLMGSHDPKSQIIFIFSHPLQYLSIFCTSIQTSPPPWLALQGVLGILGSLAIGFPNKFYNFIIFSFFLILAMSNDGAVRLNGLQRIILFISFGITLFLIFTLQYLFWTNPANPLIEGFQGRYLLGIVPLLILSGYRLELKRWTKWIIVVVLLLLIGYHWNSSWPVLLAMLGLFLVGSNFLRQRLSKITKGIIMLALYSIIAVVSLTAIYSYYYNYYHPGACTQMSDAN
jgi:uncharacterized membrane protein